MKLCKRAGNARADGPTVLVESGPTPKASRDPCGESPGAMRRQDFRPLHPARWTPECKYSGGSSRTSRVGPDSTSITSDPQQARQLVSARRHQVPRAGPIQLTGRYNYQSFADDAQSPDLMTNTAMLADKVNNPLLGLRAAGFF